MEFKKGKFKGSLNNRIARWAKSYLSNGDDKVIKRIIRGCLRFSEAKKNKQFSWSLTEAQATRLNTAMTGQPTQSKKKPDKGAEEEE